MNLIIANNIKSLREKNKLSMDELAKLSGVSKSMLAQIERGAGNPTVSTLWKISNGLKVPFDALIIQRECSYEIVSPASIQPLLENNGKVKNYPLFPDNENRKFAIYHLEFSPESCLISDPHLLGTTEFITVYKGSLEINVDNKRFNLNPYESLRFNADRVHSYKNNTNDLVLVHMILYNP